MKQLANELVKRIEGDARLDRLSKPVVDAASKAVEPRLVRNALSGTPVGNPIHPALTDLPVGAWVFASVMDLIGGERLEDAADFLIKAGIVTALPAAATGLNDLSDTYGPETRVGIVHASAIASALGMYFLSSRARKRGARRTGKLLALLGLGTMSAGAYLGGHLSFHMGVNVNRTAWEYGPSEWTAVLPAVELADGEHRKVDAAGVAVLLWRQGEKIWALSNTCSHMGGPLDQGKFSDGCVTCPWHGSVFQMDDGSIERGPASVDQPVYEARINEDQIEVRSSS